MRSSEVHLINPLRNQFGGSEMLALAYAQEFAPKCTVRLWSEYDVAPAISECVSVSPLSSASYPRAGTLCFVGCYFKVGEWVRRSHPRRLIVIVNTPDVLGVHAFLSHLRDAGLPGPELVFASGWLRDAVGIGGRIDFSTISSALFSAKPVFDSRRFTVGRLSRDVLGKHHPEDVKLYDELSAAGITVRLMGAGTLYGAMSQKPPAGVELIPEGAEPAKDFLLSLQCFLYRTHPAWTEPHGRVVTEAMATGIPVVCENRGGYTEFIEHGVNGYLFTNASEAIRIVRHLQRNADLCNQVGLRGRDTVLSLLEARADFATYCCAATTNR
jgi:glycosyltransferase involved in cell wall biosynthesis